ncbi:MAG: FAD/NAD(P)-binding protein [Legionella sp.]|jgi:hypothetical protein
MANYVIVGAGLGGLYVANRLINKGISPNNIRIIEKRPNNHYTRPGHLNQSIFNLVTENTQIETPHSPAYHIKELERVMYNHLHSLHVRFIEEEFFGLQAKTDHQPKAVITRKGDVYQCVYPADYVFDCSGKKASVAQAVNDYQQSIGSMPAFESKSLVDINPIRHHLLAHVVIPDNSSLIDFMDERQSEPIPAHIQRSSLKKNIELREKLKALGWTYEAFPTFYSLNGVGDKVCLYMETPPDLTQDKQPGWIRLLLDIYSDGKIQEYTELKPSKKYQTKPRIIGFESVPYVLNKAIHKSVNLPTVLIGFDALKGFDYRSANGFESGVECFEHMLRHIRFTDGDIQAINSEDAELIIFRYINYRYKYRIASALGARQKAIENAFASFSEIYEKAAATTIFDAEKRQDYQITAGELAYQAVIMQFNRLKTREQNTIESLEVLNKYLSVLIRAQNTMPCSKTNEHDDVNSKLLSVIDTIQTEVSAVNTKQILNHSSHNNGKLYTLFAGIKQNYLKLEDNYTKFSPK